MTSNNLELQFTSVSSVLCVLSTKRLRLESLGFRYKVALYLRYLHIKFGDEIGRESLRMSSIISN